MKLEEQVCSLELARKLKTLGVKQEALYEWTQTYTRKTGEYLRDSKPYLAKTPKGSVGTQDFAAFTVAELGEMLPPLVEINDDTYGLVIDWDNRRGRMLRYERSDGSNFTQEGDTEADARAKMLIYLLDNRLISL